MRADARYFPQLFYGFVTLILPFTPYAFNDKREPNRPEPFVPAVYLSFMSTPPPPRVSFTPCVVATSSMLTPF